MAGPMCCRTMECRVDREIRAYGCGSRGHAVRWSLGRGSGVHVEWLRAWWAMVGASGGGHHRCSDGVRLSDSVGCGAARSPLNLEFPHQKGVLADAPT